MRQLNWIVLLLASISTFGAMQVAAGEVFLGQGTMSGEVTECSALLQTRLTTTTQLDATGDLPGATGVVHFQWATTKDFGDAQRTSSAEAIAESDFIVRAQLTQLQPNTRYFYRAVYDANAADDNAMTTGPTCSFKTLPGAKSDQPVRFLVGSCMNYNKFMHGKLGSSGKAPLTATGEDKRLGYPAFASMQALNADFFVGTGDIVYYDNKFRQSETVAQLRLCWHEQFRFPRMIDFFQHVPAYWSKDDHDFRFNESDNSSARLPLPTTGIELFREQLPIVAMNDRSSPTYRTHRINRDLQVWITEGRDY